MRFYISSNGDDFWNETNAKTLRGAKAIASKTYQQSVGGRIVVAMKDDGQYYTIASKRGFDAWTDTFNVKLTK